MRVAGPRRLELRPEGDHQQHGQALQALHREVEQLERGRVDPVRVLEDHQDGPARGEALELPQQSLEGPRLPLLRVELERRVALLRRDREEVGEERHGARDVVHRRADQRLQLVEPDVRGVVLRQTRRSPELLHHRPERAVRVVGRALVPQARRPLGPEPLAQRQDEPRLADAGLAAEQDDLALALLGALPAVEQQRDLVLPAHQRREPGTAQGLEAALGRTLADHAPRRSPAPRSP